MEVRTVNISAQLHREAKVLCARSGISLRSFIEDAIRLRLLLRESSIIPGTRKAKRERKG